MDEKYCYRCGTKHLINDINYQMENCSHIYCVNCVFQDIFVNSLSDINNLEEFTVNCKCDSSGSIKIPIDSIENLFSKKLAVDSEEIKEKNLCKKHRNVEKTYFCKKCEMYVCPECTSINEKEENDNSNKIIQETPNEMNEHFDHEIVKAEELCNKYKDFLKDIQIESKTANQFVEKFNIEINKYESELDNEINTTVKQIDEIIDKLYRIKDEYTKIIEKKYSNCNLLLKIIKLFYANYYLDYENRLNINDVFTLKYLKDVNYEFDNLDFTRDNKEDSLENLLINIRNYIEKIDIKKYQKNNFSFKFNTISRKFNIIQKLLGHRQTINSIIELHDGRILTGSSDYKMKFWEDQGGRFVETLTISEMTGNIYCLYELKLTLSEHKSCVTCLVQLPDERLLTGSKDKTIIIWDISDNAIKCTQIINEHKEGVYSLCLLTGVRFASGSEDKSIGIWEYKDGLYKNETYLKDHKTRVRALAMTNNTFFITGGDKIIIVYKLKDAKFIKFGTFNAHANQITKIIKLSDGKIATCGRDCLIKIWNENNGELLLSEILKGHTHSVYDIVELKDGRLASVSGDNLVIIWKSGKIID